MTAVDGQGESVATYRLKNPAKVCIPLPAELRGSLDQLSIVSADEFGLTALSTRVVLRAGGDPQLCGSISALPARVAAARFGAPPLPFPAGSQDGRPATPDTGGGGANVPMLFILLVAGAASIAMGLRTTTSSFRKRT